SFIASPNQVISPSLETFSLSDLTPLSSTITVDKDEVVDVSICRIQKECGHCLCGGRGGGESSQASSFSLSDLTPLSSTITVDKDEVVYVSVSHCRSAESKTSADIVSVEAEVVVNHLKQARIQVMNSTNADLQSKKLLNALIEVVIEEFNALPEEKDRLSELVSMKTRVVFMIFLVWVVAVLMFLHFSSRGQSSFSELPPT
ncbi:hypothetical protein HYC85_012802, partial [Camellia sinensis]